MRRSLAALALLVASPATAQAGSDALSLAEARSLPPEALARRVLGASGVLVKEAAIEGANSRFADSRRLARITFASAPRAGGSPGICVTDVYRVGFAPVSDGEKLFDSPGPAPVASLRSETVYRIVDAGPVPSGLWSDEYAARLAAACKRAGSVIRSGPVGGLNYFSAANEAEASFVRKLLIDFRDKPNPTICHARRPDWCQARAAAFLSLSFSYATVGPCETGERWCVAIGYDWGLDSTVLTVEIDRPHNLSEPAIVRSADVAEDQGIE